MFSQTDQLSNTKGASSALILWVPAQPTGWGLGHQDFSPFRPQSQAPGRLLLTINRGFPWLPPQVWEFDGSQENTVLRFAGSLWRNNSGGGGPGEEQGRARSWEEQVRAPVPPGHPPATLPQAQVLTAGAHCLELSKCASLRSFLLLHLQVLAPSCRSVFGAHSPRPLITRSFQGPGPSWGYPGFPPT